MAIPIDGLGRSLASKKSVPINEVVAQAATKKSTVTDPKSTNKRRRGRPPKDKSPFTPTVLREIAELWLRNDPLQQIVDKFGVTPNAVAYHIRRSIIPVWEKQLVNNAAATLMKLQHIARTAYHRWTEENDPEGARMLRWAVDRQIKILGHNAPQKIQVKDASYRVASTSRKALSEKMLHRLVEKLDQLKRQRQIVEQSYEIQPATRESV